MRFLLSKDFGTQLKHDAYLQHTHNYLRQASSDLPETVTELLDELGTTDETIGDAEEETMLTTIGTTLDHMRNFDETSETTKFNSIQEAITAAQTSASPPHSNTASDAAGDPGHTILIVLGVLLAILMIVCCILACIFARLRRKGFCTVEGKNQPMCDEECRGGESSAQLSPKESMSSGKSLNSRSSDKLLTK